MTDTDNYDDLIPLAEAALESDCMDSSLAVFVPPLIAALKAANARYEGLQKYVTRHSDLCCDQAGLGHYDSVSCKVHPT